MKEQNSVLRKIKKDYNAGPGNFKVRFLLKIKVILYPAKFAA